MSSDLRDSIVGTHGISIRYTSFMKEPTGFLFVTPLSRDYSLHFFHGKSVTDRNPVGSDDEGIDDDSRIYCCI